MDAETKEFRAAKGHILKTVETTLEAAERLKCLIYDRTGFDRAMEILCRLTDECSIRRDAYLSDEGADTLHKMTNGMSQLLGAVQMCSSVVNVKVRAK